MSAITPKLNDCIHYLYVVCELCSLCTTRFSTQTTRNETYSCDIPNKRCTTNKIK